MSTVRMLGPTTSPALMRSRILMASPGPEAMSNTVVKPHLVSMAFSSALRAAGGAALS